MIKEFALEVIVDVNKNQPNLVSRIRSLTMKATGRIVITNAAHPAQIMKTATSAVELFNVSRTKAALRASAVGVQLRLATKVAVAGLLTLSLTSPVQGSDSIGPKALKALFPGTLEAVVHGYSVSFTAHKDGSLVGQYASATDTGQWSINQGQLCITLSNWLNGRTVCARVVQHGNWYQVNNVLFRKP